MYSPALAIHIYIYERVALALARASFAVLVALALAAGGEASRIISAIGVASLTISRVKWACCNW